MKEWKVEGYSPIAYAGIHIVDATQGLLGKEVAIIYPNPQGKSQESGEALANAYLMAAAPLGHELAEFVANISATWIEEGLLEIGEGDYQRMKILALEFLAKAKGK